MSGLPDREIQSHFVRAEFQGEKRRDWSLFAFFRVMTEEEVQSTVARITAPPPAPVAGNKQADREAAGPSTSGQLKLEFANPTLWTSFVEAAPSDRGPAPPQPSARFLSWLNAVVGDGAGPMVGEALRFAEQLQGSVSFMELFASEFQSSMSIASGVKLNAKNLSSEVRGLIQTMLEDDGPDHGLRMLKEGLETVCAYELIRQVNRAHQGVPLVRSADASAIAREASDGGDRSPVEIAFTHQGLRAAGVSERVLNSFPDVFKEGMAARAARLGDVGKSAPSQWSGELGQQGIHGLISGGFKIEGANDADWEKLRRQIYAFNEASPGEGQRLRMSLGMFFSFIGLEILHIELGQEPYNVDSEGWISRPKHRHEHFGFRDGISQPAIELDLGEAKPQPSYGPNSDDIKPGSGTPSRRASWAPLAPGEVFLGLADEDGCTQIAPAHEALRDGGTYLVFRKLQQDVGGFRTYLASVRPNSKIEQERLAASFVGRWKNGVSLVRAPTSPPDFADAQEADLNNFRYSEDDPAGRRCPLGAHVRRTNPRDIGGQVEAKRHRILRRGMSYGGPFLAEGSLGDGRERGMLFIALNARIDLQFELMQSRWINGGEFLGQGGLGKCPITGANAGLARDQFIPGDGAPPVNRIPSFVYTRGGDYFYAPGIQGLKEIAGKKVGPPTLDTPNESGHGSAKTEDVFSPDNIRRLMDVTLKGPGYENVAFKKVVDPKPYIEDPASGAPMVFVGKHEHVVAVLSGELPSVGVRHYTDASRRMMIGESGRLLIGTESDDAKLRAPMKEILTRAWDVLKPYEAIERALDRAISNALVRTRQVGQIDLIQDLAVDPIYQIISTVYGVPGPKWLTELAMALPFGRQHVSELHPDWLAVLSGKAQPQNPRLATMQIWSILMFSDLIGNLRLQEELKALSMQAASEFTVYLEQLLMKERAKPKVKLAPPKTLLEAFCAIEGETFAGRKLPPAEYYSMVRLLLTELVPSALAVIPATFGSLMVAMLNNRVNLNALVGFLDNVDEKEGNTGPKRQYVKRLIYETNRLSPSLPLLQRYAADDVVLNGLTIKKGRWIGALVAAANFDENAFEDPYKFSLGKTLNGPPRDLQKYLMFGGRETNRECWGRERLAMFALEKFVRAASKLPGLRRVAGAGGAPVQLLRTMIGLPARFARH